MATLTKTIFFAQAIAAGVGFWVVGVPLSALLGLQLGFGVKGLWIGLAVGEFPLVLFYLYLLRYDEPQTEAGR